MKALCLVVVILTLNSCMKNTSTTIVSTITSIPMVSSTFTQLPSSTVTLPSETPTIPVEQLYKNLVLLIQDENCVLPCLMGIDPSVSNTVDVHNLLLPFQTLTKYGSLSVDSDGGLSIEYPSSAISTTSIMILYYPSTKKQGMLDHIFLYTMATITGRTGSDPITFADPDYHQLLQRYSLPAILSSFGRPTQVFLSVMPSTGAEPGVASFFDLRLAYPDKGFYLSYYSLAAELDNSYQACPSYSFVAIWSEAPAPGLSTEDLINKMNNWPFFDFALGFKPLEKATNMTIDQFYRSFSQSTDKCINTPKSTWPTY
jgi:hypothetical protein